MSRFVSKTLRKLPSATREVARLSNEIASAQVRLANRVSRLAELERTADASLRVRCTNGAHASLVAASLNFVRSLDPETSGRARTAAIGRLKDTVAPFCPDTLFPDEDHARVEPGAEDPNAELADHVADALKGDEVQGAGDRS